MHKKKIRRLKNRMDDTALFTAKWGAQTREMGNHDLITIGCAHFVVVTLVLFVLRPTIVLGPRRFLRSSHPSILRVVLIATLVCLATYFKPIIYG